MSKFRSIVNRQPEDPIALVASSLPALASHRTPDQPLIRIHTARFIAHAQSVAQQLPDAKYAINLCENRYLFSVVFVAIILKKQTNLLPQNRTLLTQKTLIDDYKTCHIVHDGIKEVDPSVHSLNINELELPLVDAETIPEVDLEHLAAIAFTSGSTGTPKPNLKYWKTFTDSTYDNARQMLPSVSELSYCLATVPGQHMWGLETSVLIPLISNVCVYDTKPLFPQDVASQLNSMPEPRTLVSTPVHLRALVQSDAIFPKVHRILVATAPLSASLAKEVEQVFRGDLVEVFGCSEVGSMARRQTATEEEWRLFPSLHIKNDNDAFVLSAEHLPEKVVLQDRLEFSSPRQFRLCGRNEDVIEVAGKRGSLLELNKILLECSGVSDGIVFVPENASPEKEHSSKKSGVRRPVALVVAAHKQDKKQLQSAFATRLDPVFVPRPIIFVDALPREENGKLKQNKVLELFHTLTSELSI